MTYQNKKNATGVIGAVCLSLIVISCGSASNQLNISSSTFQGEWMLTVDSGKLVCEDPSTIIFIAPDGTRYAVNGTAKNRGYTDIRPIWKDDPQIPGNKINIGTLIDEGLKLCQ
jgi:hypothetical protein